MPYRGVFPDQYAKEGERGASSLFELKKRILNAVQADAKLKGHARWRSSSWMFLHWSLVSAGRETPVARSLTMGDLEFLGV
jgi:hypothetical protein